MHKLPDKPSELIRLALADLRKVEAKPDVYIVDMSNWHSGSGNDHRGLCSVCLAGAVIAQTLDVSPTRTVCISPPLPPFVKPEFDDDTDNKLDALDTMRRGNRGSSYLITFISGVEQLIGYGRLNETQMTLCHRVQITPYGDDKEQFHVDMEATAAMLASWGF